MCTGLCETETGFADVAYPPQRAPSALSEAARLMSAKLGEAVVGEDLIGVKSCGRGVKATSPAGQGRCPLVTH
jgi:hypothetical protein